MCKIVFSEYYIKYKLIISIYSYRKGELHFPLLPIPLINN